MKNSLQNFSSKSLSVFDPKRGYFIKSTDSAFYKNRSFCSKSHENRVSWKRIDSLRRKIVSFQDISARNEKARKISLKNRRDCDEQLHQIMNKRSADCVLTE